MNKQFIAKELLKIAKILTAGSDFDVEKEKKELVFDKYCKSKSFKENNCLARFWYNSISGINVSLEDVESVSFKSRNLKDAIERLEEKIKVAKKARAILGNLLAEGKKRGFSDDVSYNVSSSF